MLLSANNEPALSSESLLIVASSYSVDEDSSSTLLADCCALSSAKPLDVSAESDSAGARLCRWFAEGARGFEFAVGALPSW